MALYPYECTACGHSFEELQAMADEPLKDCPSCGRATLERTLSLPNAICRGSPRCVGQLMEDNTRKLVAKHGREGANEVMKKRVYGTHGKKLRLPRGAKILPRPKAVETPWFRSGEVEGTGPRSDAPLDLTRVKDVKKYVIKGEK